MKILVFVDSLAMVPRYRRGIRHDLYFMTHGTPGIKGLPLVIIELLRLLRRLDLGGILLLIRTWLGGRVCFAYQGLNSEKTLAMIQSIAPRLALHQMGTIYRQATIDACGLGILNAHIGCLPRFRGRSVMEWSLFCGHETGTTVFFIDGGIDTGRGIVNFYPSSVVGIESLDAAKTYLFSQAAERYRDAIESLELGKESLVNDLRSGNRFYEMSHLFRDAIEKSRQASAKK